MKGSDSIHIGTCSWKYDSWRGLVYPEDQPINYLKEYCKYFNTVEIDQWFWSLFKGDAVVLPKSEVVREYVHSVPEDFMFSIKVPNSITLTHHYSKGKKTPLQINPHFLSGDLMKRFLDTIEPIHPQVGCLMFQFDYLNKQKMESMELFMDKFGSFAQSLPAGFNYGIEIRNPNFLKRSYFEFLEELEHTHVFLQGYYMPPIFEVYEKYREYIKRLSVIRLHGPDRKGIEKATGKDWSQIVSPQDGAIAKLRLMLEELTNQKVMSFVYVNNHFEGSAPRTIQKIIEPY